MNVIRTKVNIGEEENEILKALVLNSPKSLKEQKQYKLLLVAMGIMATIAGVLGNRWWLGLALVGLVGALLVRPIHKLVINQLYKKMDPKLITGERKYAIDESGIAVTAFDKTGIMKWDEFIAAGTMSHYIWIRRNNNTAVLIDKNNLTADEQSELMELVKGIM